MSNTNNNIHGQWSTRLAFILAVSGSAVGLGNIWKFPYITGMNGGGAFVLVYLACILMIGLPILMSEVLLGRMGQKNPIETMRTLGIQYAGSGLWSLVGILGVLTGVLIHSYYSVVAGWAMNYVYLGLSGTLDNVDAVNATLIFTGVVSSPTNLIFWHSLFMISTAVVVGKGVVHGIERSIKILMPLLFLLLLVLLGFSIVNGDAVSAFYFLFKFNFDLLTAEAILIALGHAFFTLSLGMGAVMAYGAYLPRGHSISRLAISIVFVDTIVALIAGMVIFSVVFANDLSIGQGPGLVFQTLPIAFSSLPLTSLASVLFFVLLVAAAWTSSISLIEPAVAWLVEAFSFSRQKATYFIAFIIWMLGLLSVFSFNSLSEFIFWKGTWFDNFDFLTANLLLPFGGLLISIFAGWKLSFNISSSEINTTKLYWFRLWRFLSRYIAPVGIMIIFLDGLGVI